MVVDPPHLPPTQGALVPNAHADRYYRHEKGRPEDIREYYNPNKKKFNELRLDWQMIVEQESPDLSRMTVYLNCSTRGRRLVSVVFAVASTQLQMFPQCPDVVNVGPYQRCRWSKRSTKLTMGLDSFSTRRRMSPDSFSTNVGCCRLTFRPGVGCCQFISAIDWRIFQRCSAKTENSSNKQPNAVHPLITVRTTTANDGGW